MKKSRRSQLLQHIAEITSIAIANKEYTGINTDAFTISLDLNLDRANVRDAPPFICTVKHC